MRSQSTTRNVRLPLVAGIWTACLLFAVTIACSAQITFTKYPGPSTPVFGNGDSLFDIAAGTDGNLWFTENDAVGGAQTSIGRITPAGTTEYFLIPSGSSAGGIAAGPDGNMWFTEYITNKIGRVTPVGVFAEFDIPGGWSYPTAIAQGSDHNMWFTMSVGTHADKIGRITVAGDITLFPIPSGANAVRITAGHDGNLWFTENVGNRIGRITPEGTVTEYDVPTSGSYPYGITAGPDGNVWFVEELADKIGRITPSGTITEFAGLTAGGSPAFITAGPDGNLWFTELYGDRLGRITPSGVVSEFLVPDAGSRPTGITTGPDGNLWFLEMHANFIVKAVIRQHTTLYAQDRTGVITEPVTLKGYLRRQSDLAWVAGKPLAFSVDGTPVGTATTNVIGVAVLNWTITDGPASRTITIDFAGDTEYGPSTGNGTLTALSFDTDTYVPDRAAEIADTALLKAYLYRASSHLPVVGKSVVFSVDGTTVGSGATNASGRALLSYTVPVGSGAGARSLSGDWNGDGGYRPSSGSATLYVGKALTYLVLASRSAQQGTNTYLRAYLRSLPDYTWLTGKTVRFLMDGTALGTAVTDAGGRASYLYNVNLAVGSHPMSAAFDGDATYRPSGGIGVLTVTP